MQMHAREGGFHSHHPLTCQCNTRRNARRSQACCSTRAPWWFILIAALAVALWLIVMLAPLLGPVIFPDAFTKKEQFHETTLVVCRRGSDVHVGGERLAIIV